MEQLESRLTFKTKEIEKALEDRIKYGEVRDYVNEESDRVKTEIIE